MCSAAKGPSESLAAPINPINTETPMGRSSSDDDWREDATDSLRKQCPGGISGQRCDKLLLTKFFKGRCTRTQSRV